jgi:hypothetical protein
MCSELFTIFHYMSTCIMCIFTIVKTLQSELIFWKVKCFADAQSYRLMYYAEADKMYESSFMNDIEKTQMISSCLHTRNIFCPWLGESVSE